MKPATSEWLAALAPAALLASFALCAAAFVLPTLDDAERTVLAEIAGSRGTLLVFAALVMAGGAGWWLHRAWRRYGAAPARLAESLQAVLASGDLARRLVAEGSAGSRALAAECNRLLTERAAAQSAIDERVREAAHRVDLERGRLAALMSELTQSVVVCNLDGRVLLYNNRARLQFRALSAAPAAGGSELLGIGRSIYAVFEPERIAHALESVQQRLARGVPHPSANFVTATRSGQLLRVQLAPVRDPGAESLAGFLLMLDNITRDFAAEAERDRRLHEHTESSRGLIGSTLARLDRLEAAVAGEQGALREAARDELRLLARRTDELAEHTAATLRTRWPLEEMHGADLLAAAARRIESAHDCRVAADAVDGGLWLKVDSYSLMQALVHLAGKVVEEFGLRLVWLRLVAVDGSAQLDLAWVGHAVSTETMIGWETEAIRSEGEGSALTVRDIVQRHGGSFGFERERVRHESILRFTLPLAEAGDGLDAALLPRADARPEFYDFDLFGHRELGGALAERRLAELAYTVFDTETTGLDPSNGDVILQIGATRIVAGKLRRSECFEQLVDPGRSIPEAGIAVHGITPAMVAGQPAIGHVLPAFHAFVADTVLVAHNAAFDMRFLEIQQGACGVRFDQPVLDTLLLSSIVHPHQDSHSLDAMAERLGVPVLGRHTALGDAIVTAEVFLRLVPLLQARGIETLGQALEASEESYLARLKY